MSNLKNSSSIKIAPEHKELCDLVGEFIEYWGFKKIHGQIWCHIFLSPTPLDATTLVKRLNVSKALVSLAIQDLLHYEVILNAGKGSRRRVLFVSNPELMNVICSVLRARERKMLSQIMSACRNLKKVHTLDQNNQDADPEKLIQLTEMVDMAESTLDSLIQCQVLPINFNK